MASTVDMKKAGAIGDVDFGATGPGKPFENSDTTADIKEKLARKIGYGKKGDTALPPFMHRPFQQFRKILKTKQKVEKKSKVG